MATHHIASLLIPSWGHVVSYISLVVQMLQKDPTLVITMVQHNSDVPKMEAELQTWAYDISRLRIIGIGEKDMRIGPDMIKVAFAQLIEGWLQTAAQLAQGSEGWPKPHAIHMDHLAGGFVFEPTKTIMGPACKMLLWFSTGLVSLKVQLHDYDFAAIAQEIYSDEARRQGRSMDDILDQVADAWNGTDKLSGLVIKCPGIPDVYDYERKAHGAGSSKGVAKMLVGAQKFAKLADGFIVPSSTCFEPAGVQYYRDFYHKRGQELFTVGLQAHEVCWTDAAPVPPTNEVVRSFLDNALSQYGPNSVLYISFGSFFFPTANPKLIETLVSTLLEKPFPFIFALGGKMATLPKELIERANFSGKGLICDFWVEQSRILHHRALGWFLTHGGYNSVCEALCRGTPLIIWPVTSEQPLNAALLSSGPDPVAIELVQIRAGPSLAPSLRGGPAITGTVEDVSNEFKAAFEAARGPKGAILKPNAVKMAKALREARAGEASDELIRLTKF
ncbi:hypothetical protein C8R44DRAFT_973525 [Mycena epipterygia]|nr:hypothetical protein C8R44DRAFT_973525 [Mycena epipterygia]